MEGDVLSAFFFCFTPREPQPILFSVFTCFRSCAVESTAARHFLHPHPPHTELLNPKTSPGTPPLPPPPMLCAGRPSFLHSPHLWMDHRPMWSPSPHLPRPHQKKTTTSHAMATSEAHRVQSTTPSSGDWDDDSASSSSELVLTRAGSETNLVPRSYPLPALLFRSSLSFF